MSQPLLFDTDLLCAALEGLQHRLALVERRISELRQRLGSSTSVSTVLAETPRKLTEEGRKRIIEAQKRRWAAVRQKRARTEKNRSGSAKASVTRRRTATGTAMNGSAS
jgi:hypothetical protein